MKERPRFVGRGRFAPGGGRKGRWPLTVGPVLDACVRHLALAVRAGRDESDRPSAALGAKGARLVHEEPADVVEVRGENCTVFFLEDGKRRDLKQTKLEPCS